MIWIALAVRVALFLWAVPKGHWALADTQYYLDNARMICGGEWGGDLHRTPLFSWFLCGTSFGGITLALAIQSLLTWIIGVKLSKGPTPFHRAAAIICFFDPVLLVYSQLAMSDSIFAILVFLMALQLNRSIVEGTRASLVQAALLGVVLAAVVLQRPIGEPLVAMTALFLVGLACLRRIKPAAVLTVFLITTALLLPRLLWVHEHYGMWTLARQGESYLYSTAGAVEYSGTGLDLYQSEKKWAVEHPDADRALALRTIGERFPTFLGLSLKGAARILIGHVNVEWVYILTGKGVVGPGWFKVKQQIPGAVEITGPLLTLIWCLGLLWTLVFCVWEYSLVLKRVFQRQRAGSKPDPAFLAWAAIAAAALIAAPQVWGDARFRAPILAILIAVLVCESRKPKHDPS